MMIKQVFLSDILKFKNGKKRPKEGGTVPVYGGNGILGYSNSSNSEECIIIGRVGAYCGNVYYEKNKCWISDNAISAYVKEGTDIVYAYYLLKSLHLNKRKIGTSQPLLTQEILNNIETPILSHFDQIKVGRILSIIDEKIHLNMEINNNLEQQISALFINMFGSNIDKLAESKFKLGDLVDSVDNRGKTPPLSDKPTLYPIIDVKALSGNIRIVDYNNCTKYVNEETYNNWFRSGHPKQYDILVSTVGSLAEMKIFLGDVGCIAQNVVGFRSKDISPLYLYQYLNYIKNDLVAYNIGSVQPSIKVTHIIKHPIYVAPQDEINKFDSVARSITEKIFANCQENENLKQLRDTLLPKLMSGELDVSDIDL